jgi:hypothetical protein
LLLALGFRNSIGLIIFEKDFCFVFGYLFKHNYILYTY